MKRRSGAGSQPVKSRRRKTAIAGGIGVSGDYSEHDAQIAQAGGDAVIEA